MQQIKKFFRVSQLLRKWPNKSRSNILFEQQNVRSVKWDSLEKQRHDFVQHMQNLLPMSYEQGKKMFDEMPRSKSNIKLLLAKKINEQSIIDNPFLLLMKCGKHERK